MDGQAEPLGAFRRSSIGNHVGQLRRLSNVQKLSIGEKFWQRDQFFPREAQRKITNDVIRSFREKEADATWQSRRPLRVSANAFDKRTI